MIGYNKLATDTGTDNTTLLHDPGLGNQLYTFASTVGIARRKGYDFCVPETTLLRQFFKMGGVRFGLMEGRPIYKAQDRVRTFHYCESFVNHCPDEVDLIGPFFSEKYFKHAEEELRQILEFKDEILTVARRTRKQISNGPLIAIQVRRGDAIALNPICTMSYYMDALAEIDGYLNTRLPVAIITNDPLWCLSQQDFNDPRFTVIVDEDGKKHSGRPYPSAEAMTYTKDMVENYGADRIQYVPNYGYSLCLMALCNHFVIGNSTFGVWGAWLAKKKGIVIRPHAHWNLIETPDYYPEDWWPRRGW